MAHNTQDARDKIGTLYQDLANKFHDFLNDYDDERSFEDACQKLVIENMLEKNEWLKEIYNICKKWCPMFLVDYFLQG